MERTSTESHPIAIVGGGLGGLALAVGLVKRGVAVHIYESASVFSEIGAGIAFGPNATRALALIDEALLEGFKKHATFNENRESDDVFLSFRWGMDEKREDGAKAGDLMFQLQDIWEPRKAKNLGVRARSCIHRARLLELLVSLLPSDIASFGKGFQEVKERPDGMLELHFTDGTIALASAIIGCDGIKSKVRSFVCGPQIEATYAGSYAYRAMVPRAEAEKMLGAELARNGQRYCGYGAYIVTYPVEHGEFTNMVAIPHEQSSAWEWNHADWTIPAAVEEINNLFQGWYPPLIDLIVRYSQPQKWALFNLQHAAPYYKGRMCLLGDSAHATTPHLGAGAGMAIEDAFVLSDLIASSSGRKDIEKAFYAFDAVRRPPTQQVVEDSLRAGLTSEFIMPGVEDDVATIQAKFKTWNKMLWHERDIEIQLEEAKRLM